MSLDMLKESAIRKSSSQKRRNFPFVRVYASVDESKRARKKKKGRDFCITFYSSEKLKNL